jgi:hypothetical protein
MCRGTVTYVRRWRPLWIALGPIDQLSLQCANGVLRIEALPVPKSRTLTNDGSADRGEYRQAAGAAAAMRPGSGNRTRMVITDRVGLGCI